MRPHGNQELFCYAFEDLKLNLKILRAVLTASFLI